MKSLKILVFIECDEQCKLKKQSKELLTQAFGLKRDEMDEVVALSVVDFSEKKDILNSHINEVSLYGADRTLIIKSSRSNHYSPESYTDLVEKVIRTYEPQAVLFGEGAMAKAISARISVRLDMGALSNCVRIYRENGDLIATRASYGSALMAKVRSNSSIKLISMQAGAVDIEINQNQKMQTTFLEGVMSVSNHHRFVEVLHTFKAQHSIEGAKVIVAGGRGLGSKEGFDLLGELAELIGGEIAGTRAAVDLGWIPFSKQIGQTGKNVVADIYIGVGISGAMHHISGMRRSKCIIAINNSPLAPILDIADYSIVADYKEVLPLMIDRIKKWKQNEKAVFEMPK